jgi:hypothetical protein
MPRTKQDHLWDLAKHGAEMRVRELVQELKSLVRVFPHLRDSFDPDELPVSFIIARAAGRPRRKRMSVATRKAVSARMTRYWQEWRKRKQTGRRRRRQG